MLDIANEHTHEMAMIVTLSIIVTQPVKCIVLGDMLGVLFDEFLGAVPYGWDGLNIFVETEDKAIDLLMLGHVPEWIEPDIAKELDARFHSPVPLIFHEQGLTEEEA